MVDHVGKQLGNYRIIRPIGHGGFADVYLGEHVYLQTQVALKLLQMRLAEEDIEEFLKEARTIAHLIHPHIVRVLDFGIEGGTPFLVMDYAPNGSLRRRHPKGTRLPLDTVVSYTKQVAEALQYAHEKKLIHRDIKPENILLGENHQVLLSDFGTALITQSTRYQNTQEVIGTAAYMAPEQLQGKPRRASDQYALSIVVYEWLCGDRPFHGSFTEIYSQHMFIPPPPLCEKLPELLPAIEEVVLRALAKDPKERFATIQAFATALEQACQIASSPPITLPSELPSPSQPLPPTDMVAAFPSSQLSGPEPPNAVTPSLPHIPLKGLSVTTISESSPVSHLQRHGKTASVSKTRGNTVVVNRHWGLHKSKIVLLIGLALLVLIASLGFFSTINGRRANDGAHATFTAQTNSTVTTLTTLQKIYPTITREKPILDDPLNDNSRGNNWDVINQNGNICRFSGGYYDAITSNISNLKHCSAEATNFSNFVYQVQMTIIQGDCGGIIFRTDYPKSYYFGICQDGNYDFGLASSSQVQMDTGSSSAINTGLNHDNLIAVVASGDTFLLYVNQQYVSIMTDGIYSHGQIGVAALDRNNPTEVEFRNIKMWTL